MGDKTKSKIQVDEKHKERHWFGHDVGKHLDQETNWCVNLSHVEHLEERTQNAQYEKDADVLFVFVFLGKYQ